MKRCPECTSGFPDSFEFCERDGTLLLTDFRDDPELSAPPTTTSDYPQPEGEPYEFAPSAVDPPGPIGTIAYPVSVEERLRQNWQMLALMMVAGVGVALVFFFVYQPMTRDAQNQNANELITNGGLPQSPIHVLPLRPSPSPSESPSPEPSPSPSAMPSPTAQVESLPELSSGMVSTGGDGKTGRGPVTIRLANGMNVEADEVWQTEDGIWYRRRGIATLLERKEVKAIERPEEKKSTPQGSPGPSPATSRNTSP